MSSGIALHFIKHRADGGQINGLQRHNERQPGGRHGNEHIRDEDTDKNILLVADDRTLKQRIDERLELGYKGKRKVRKDAIRLVEGSVQISGDILNQPEPVQEDFFNNAFEWLKKRYGDDNVVSAVIHKDESTMHLHFDFVPLTDDGKLSAKTIIGPTGLKRVQDDFLKHMQEQYPDLGFARGDGKNNGMPQKAYEALTTETNRQKKIVDDYKDKAQDEILNQRKALNSDVKEFQTGRLNFKNYQDEWREWATKQQIGIKAKTSQLDAREQDLNDKYTRLNKSSSELRAWNNNLTERETAVKAGETDLKTRKEQADKRDRALDDRESRLDNALDTIKQIAERVASMPMAVGNRVKNVFRQYAPIDSEAKAQRLVDKLDADGLTKGLNDLNQHKQGREL